MANNDLGETIVEQEWSYFFEADEIDTKPSFLKISPPKDVLAALCGRLNLHSIEVLEADLRLERNSVSKIIEVSGKIVADIHQKCVITAEPVHEHVEDAFEAWFSEPNQTVSFTKARRERMSRKEKSDQPILEEADDPEAVVDGKIDLGELVIQHLSLSLNPYPRQEGAVFEGAEKEIESAPDGTYDNPFAALKEWKDRETKKDQ